MASELLESDKLRLFLLLDGTLIHDNEYLESLENATELIVGTGEQTQKLLFYFYIKKIFALQKRPLSFKHRLFYMIT